MFGTEPNSEPTVAESAAADVTPDLETAALLQKHADWKEGRGERPTQQEFGKLGAFAKWLRNPFGKSSNTAESGGAPSPMGQPVAMGAMATGETPPDFLEPVAIDDGLCKRTCAAVLARADTAVVTYIEREARAVTVVKQLSQDETEKVLKRFRSAASLSPADQKLIVELSPDVCRELGFDPRNLAVLTVGGIIGLHAFNIRSCVQELREMRKEAKPKEAAKDEPAQE